MGSCPCVQGTGRGSNCTQEPRVPRVKEQTRWELGQAEGRGGQRPGLRVGSHPARNPWLQNQAQSTHSNSCPNNLS